MIFNTRFISNAFILLCLFISSSAMAAKPAEPVCESSVLKSCVGECGNPSINSYLVTAEDVSNSSAKRRATFCLKVDPELTNLCPSEDIRYQLSVNGRVKSNGEMGYGYGGSVGGLISVAAREGDLVTVELEHFLNDSNILCIILGSAYVDLGYVNK